MSSGKKEPSFEQELELMRQLHKESEGFFKAVSAPETAFRDTLRDMDKKIRDFDTDNTALQTMLKNNPASKAGDDQAEIEASNRSISEALQKYYYQELYDVGTIFSDPQKLEELNKKLKNEEMENKAFLKAYGDFQRASPTPKFIPEPTRELYLEKFKKLDEAVENARQEVLVMVSQIPVVGRGRSPAFDHSSSSAAPATNTKAENEVEVEGQGQVNHNFNK